mmetsp:Transcript_19632/g.33689  ORF Transcript_19632/g.33689 Transcript_19632/m.33689 type:complete len:80 (+) Transcript_19632:29-268(+)
MQPKISGRLHKFGEKIDAETLANVNGACNLTLLKNGGKKTKHCPSPVVFKYSNQNSERETKDKTAFRKDSLLTKLTATA